MEENFRNALNAPRQPSQQEPPLTHRLGPSSNVEPRPRPPESRGSRSIESFRAPSSCRFQEERIVLTNNRPQRNENDSTRYPDEDAALDQPPTPQQDQEPAPRRPGSANSTRYVKRNHRPAYSPPEYRRGMSGSPRCGPSCSASVGFSGPVGLGTASLTQSCSSSISPSCANGARRSCEPAALNWRQQSSPKELKGMRVRIVLLIDGMLRAHQPHQVLTTIPENLQWQNNTQSLALKIERILFVNSASRESYRNEQTLRRRVTGLARKLVQIRQRKNAVMDKSTTGSGRLTSTTLATTTTATTATAMATALSSMLQRNSDKELLFQQGHERDLASSSGDGGEHPNASSVKAGGDDTVMFFST